MASFAEKALEEPNATLPSRSATSDSAVVEDIEKTSHLSHHGHNDLEKGPRLRSVDGPTTAADAATPDTKAILKHGLDADEAMKAFVGVDRSQLVLDDATNRRLLRKIDFFIMPFLCTVYCLNFLDKTTLSYASIMGIKEDTHLVGDNYSWLGSLFYFGYLAWEYPTNRLLQRLPLAKYSAVNIILWGLVLTLFATVSTFPGAATIRFFLGLFEAAVTPGFMLFTSQWYTKSEQGARTGIWFSFNGFAQIFGGLVAYGIATGNDRHRFDIAPWKIVFLLTGLLTVCVGVLFLFLMPDNQLNARFLTREERLLAIERVRVNAQGIGNRTFKPYQLREALTDPLVWALTLYSFASSIPNGGLTNFFSQLIVGFGFTPEQSLLYGAPAGAVEVLTLIVAGLLGDRWGNRLMVSVAGLSLALLGMILIVALPLGNNGGRLAGYYLTQASPAPFVALLSLISSNIAGYTKKTTVAAMYLIAYCVGNIIGPFTFRPQDSPLYRPAEIVIIVCYGVAMLDVVGIYVWCRRENRRKAAIRARPGYEKVENQEFFDLTDRENPEFVYTL